MKILIVIALSILGTYASAQSEPPEAASGQERSFDPPSGVAPADCLSALEAGSKLSAATVKDCTANCPFLDSEASKRVLSPSEKAELQACKGVVYLRTVMDRGDLANRCTWLKDKASVALLSDEDKLALQTCVINHQ